MKYFLIALVFFEVGVLTEKVYNSYKESKKWNKCFNKYVVIQKDNDYFGLPKGTLQSIGWEKSYNLLRMSSDAYLYDCIRSEK